METSILKKKVRLLPPTFWLTCVCSHWISSYLKDNFHFLTYMLSVCLLISLIKSVFNNIYIPLVGHLIVEDNALKLEAGRFSWSCLSQFVYKKEDFFSLYETLFFTENEVVKKVVAQPNEWRLVNDQALGLMDVLAKHVVMKPYSEMPNVPLDVKDYEPAIKKSLIILIGWFVVLVLTSLYVHQYYSHDSGTPILFYLAVFLLTAGGFYFYLFNSNPDCQSNVPVIILAMIISLFSASIIFKSYVIALHDVERHRFQLVKKNGGYQHWRSLDDESIEFKLGSVNNKIRTENVQGAIVMIELIKSPYLTLYLPDQIEVTRYKRNAITATVE